MRLAPALAWIPCVACAASTQAIAPIVEGPVDDPDALASGIDSLTISIAHAGSAEDLVSTTFAPGHAIDLGGVPFADDLVIHLTGRIAGNEAAYGRTCSFAFAADGPPAGDPHLYFARNVKFGSLGDAPFARLGGAALTYHDGSAVFVGGVSPDGSAVRAVERFDPRTDTTANFATIADRTNTQTALLGLGDAARIAVIGGAANATAATFVELIDADATVAGSAVERVDDLDGALARLDETATALADGRIVVIGGRPPGANMPPSGALAQIATDASGVAIRALRPALAAPRALHTATRLGDAVGAPVLIAGGLGTDGMPVATAELFRPLSNDLADPAHFAPTMVVPRSKHLARLMPDGSVLFIGGVDATGAPVRTLERFSIDAGFVAVGELPATAGVVDVSATTLPDGRILLVGGTIPPSTAPVDAAFIARLDVIDGAVDVSATDHLATPRARHQAALLCDGTVIVDGGTPSATVLERYNPPAIGRR